MNNIPQLCPGDHLLYYEDSLVDKVICLKTWADVAHIEIYTGNGMSVASRNGIGINAYAFRKEGLRYVRRPKMMPDFTAANAWFQAVRGQGYDWLGLLCFTLAVKQGSLNKQFCSEFATNWGRAAGLCPFDADWSADKVAPVQFLQSPAFTTIWRAS